MLSSENVISSCQFDIFRITLLHNTCMTGHDLYECKPVCHALPLQLEPCSSFCVSFAALFGWAHVLLGPFANSRKSPQVFGGVLHVRTMRLWYIDSSIDFRFFYLIINIIYLLHVLWDGWDIRAHSCPTVLWFRLSLKGFRFFYAWVAHCKWQSQARRCSRARVARVGVTWSIWLDYGMNKTALQKESKARIKLTLIVQDLLLVPGRFKPLVSVSGTDFW